MELYTGTLSDRDIKIYKYYIYCNKLCIGSTTKEHTLANGHYLHNINKYLELRVSNSKIVINTRTQIRLKVGRLILAHLDIIRVDANFRYLDVTETYNLMLIPK